MNDSVRTGRSRVKRRTKPSIKKGRNPLKQTIKKKSDSIPIEKANHFLSFVKQNILKFKVTIFNLMKNKLNNHLKTEKTIKVIYHQQINKNIKLMKRMAWINEKHTRETKTPKSNMKRPQCIWEENMGLYRNSECR